MNQSHRPQPLLGAALVLGVLAISQAPAAFSNDSPAESGQASAHLQGHAANDQHLDHQQLMPGQGDEKTKAGSNHDG
ncbi:hypothetical protein [Pseudomonas zhanjiangensis]|uniref:Secreted protein n=1 Tax=Pseudomonas zhanjiangensis TaxID=3239015 RepID=A0ABV3YP00_9PSED